jgi:hypothetical protein
VQKFEADRREEAMDEQRRRRRRVPSPEGKRKPKFTYVAMAPLLNSCETL